MDVALSQVDIVVCMFLALLDQERHGTPKQNHNRVPLGRFHGKNANISTLRHAGSRACESLSEVAHHLDIRPQQLHELLGSGQEPLNLVHYTHPLPGLEVFEKRLVGNAEVYQLSSALGVGARAFPMGILARSSKLSPLGYRSQDSIKRQISRKYDI